MRAVARISLVLFASVGWAQQYLISTYAGGAPLPTPIAAISASIGGGRVESPGAVAVDVAGNVYFTSLNCVFKVDVNGVLTRVAGNSREGYSGDGGPATSAQLAGPVGLALDASGNLYVAEALQPRVRKVSNGIITTLAGDGICCASGDGGPATAATLSVAGLAIDTVGNLYIADPGSNRVRKISSNGVISTVAGNGDAGYTGDGGSAASAQLFGPRSVAVDGSGNLYIADSGSNRVRRVAPNGIITTVAGTGIGGYSGDGGPATSAQIRGPLGVAVDASGSLYIADGNARVRKVVPTGIITTVAGGGGAQGTGDGGPATSAGLSPVGVAVDGAGNIYVADGGGSFRVRKIQTNGIITTIAGNGSSAYSGDNGPASLAQLSGPGFPAVDGSGYLYIPDVHNNRVRKVSPNGTITTVAGGAVGQGLGYGDGGPATSAQLVVPTGVALDASGSLYIAEFNRVRKVSPGGIITTVAGNGTCCYSGDGGPATSAQLGPAGMAVDAAGNLFIADPSSQRVRKVSSSGTITTVAGGGSDLGDGVPATSAGLLSPKDVAIDASGNIYIADVCRVRRVSPSGIITTVAGSGIINPSGYLCGFYLGDGGPATSAHLSPASVAVDARGRFTLQRVTTTWSLRSYPTEATQRLREVRHTATRGMVDRPLPPGSTSREV